MLAKRMGDAWYVAEASEMFYVSRLDEFFEKHWRCMAGEVEDPHKFLLLNELEAMEYGERMKGHNTPK